MRIVGLIAALVGLGGCVQPPPAEPARPLLLPTPVPEAGQLKDVMLGSQHGALVLPRGYPAAGLYPLLIFFHSYEQDAHQLARTRFPTLAAEEGYVVASADLGGDRHWGNPRAIALHREMLAALRANYRIDPRRIYYVGFSMGGGTALLAAMDDPAVPAAVASSQGWTNLAAMREVHEGMYAASIDAAYGGSLTLADRRRGDLVARAGDLGGLPVYLEHGDADAYVPPSQSQDLATRLTTLGLAPIFRIYQGLGHSEATLHEGAILTFFRDKTSRLSQDAR